MDGVAYIPLIDRDGTLRAEAKVDASDIARLSRWRWALNTNGYAKRTGTADEPRTVYMHREILGLPSLSRVYVDHINRDRLDNRRCNMRLVTPKQNSHNVSVISGKTSQYRGVCWQPSIGKWWARVKRNGTTHHLGYFDDEREAARVARAARAELLPYAVD